MPEADVKCPSGMTGRVRGLKGREFRLLGNRKEIRSGAAFDKILAACWLGVDESGPYDTEKGGMPDWDKVLVADRFYLLIQMRVATFPGEPYSFGLSCADADRCGKKFEWDLPMEKLTADPVPKEVLRRMASGKPLTIEIAGRVVTYALPTGATEKKASKYIKRDETDMVGILTTRMVDVKGLEKKEWDAWMDDLEFADLRDFLTALDENDGGVDTTIEVYCPHCGFDWEIDLPFGKAFFMPPKKKASKASTKRK